MLLHSGKSVPIGERLGNIASGFPDLRHDAIANASRTPVIGCQGKMIGAIAIQLCSQISRTSPEISQSVIAINPQFGRRQRHELRQTKSALGRNDERIILALTDDHGVEKPNRYAILAGYIPHEAEMRRPSPFCFHFQEP